MSDYSKTTNFASKDALLSGNPSKVVNGTELNTEFDDIATAIATKIGGATPTFTGTTTTATLNTTIDDANNAAVITPFTLTHTTSGTPGAGIGVGIDFVAETSASNNEVGASIQAVTTDVGAGAEDFALAFNVMTGGSAAAEVARFDSAGLLTTSSLNLSSSTAVSAVKDEDNMASNSATSLATQQSIKAYVDAQQDTVDTLAEVMALGSSTGGTNLIVTAGDLVTVDTINETSSAGGVTIEGVLIKDSAITLGSIALTAALDEDNMASNSASAVPTQQSVKAYVDTRVIAANGIDGVLIVGNDSLGNDLVMTAGDTITTDTIAETTGAAGVTVDGLLIKDGTVAQSSALKSATTTVDVAAATAPTAGQVLTATGATAATWQAAAGASVADITDLTATAAELNIMDGVTATFAELNLVDGVTATTAELNILDGVTATAAELNILDGVTSTAAELNILDGVTATFTELNLVDGVTATTAELNILDGVTATAAELNILDGVTATFTELNLIDGVTATTAELNILDGVTSSAAELNILDGVTSTAAELSILDGVTSTAAELNILDGVTSTAAELNILDGVTATATELNLIDGVTATTAELNYVTGATSSIQTQLDAAYELPSQTGNAGSSLTTDGSSATWQPAAGGVSAVTLLKYGAI